MRFKIFGFLGLVLYMFFSNVIFGTPQNSSKNDPDIFLESISFNHVRNEEKSDALDIMFNNPNNIDERIVVPTPEWQAKLSPYPVAYVKGTQVSIIVRFSSNEAISGKISIAAIDESLLNDTKSRVLGNMSINTPISFEWDDVKNKYISEGIHFKITIPSRIGKFEQKWRWTWNFSSTRRKKAKNIRIIDSQRSNKSTTLNQIYILFAKPQAPWYRKQRSREVLPWVEVMDKAFEWCNGETTREEVARCIGEHLYREVGGKYHFDSFYTGSGNDDFNLNSFLKLIHNVHLVNCYDMGKALVTFANVLGCGLVYEESFMRGSSNLLKPIGLDSDTHNFRVHAFADLKNKKYDASIKSCDNNSNCSFLLNTKWGGENGYKNKFLASPELASSPITFKKFGIGGKRITRVNSERMKEVKEKYNYSCWSSGSGKVIFCREISGEIITEIIEWLPKKITKKNGEWGEVVKSKEILLFREEDTKNPSEEIDSGEVDGNYTCHITRQYWSCSDGYLNLSVVVGPKSDSVKEYLIHRYADLLQDPDYIEELDFGQVGFTMAETHIAKPFRIDLIRHNVLIIMNAEGSFRDYLKKYAYLLDDFLLKSAHGIDTGELHLKFSTNFGKPPRRQRRKVYVMVKDNCASDFRFEEVEPGDNNYLGITLKRGGKIRFFPALIPRHIRISKSRIFPRKRKMKWPRKYRISFPSFLEYRKDIEIIAPKDFPPPIVIKRGEESIIRIEGFRWGPPTWWLEIRYPKDLKSNNRMLKRILTQLKRVEGRVEMGDDRQPNKE